MRNGFYPKRRIEASINYSKYFVQKVKHPTFLTVLNFDSLDSDIVRSAIRDMFDEFSDFKITEIGEMLHCFSLSYYLSEQNEIEDTFEELLSFQKTYIDNLLKKGLLPPNPLHYDPYDNEIYRISHSNAYIITKSYKQYFDEVVEYLKKNRTISSENNHLIYAEEILTSLETDLEQFKLLLLGNERKAGKYSNIDIMKSINPEDFMIQWLMRPVESWRRVKDILESRYVNSARSIIKSEEQWLSELCLHLFAEAERHKGIDRVKIKLLIPFGALQAF